MSKQKFNFCLRTKDLAIIWEGEVPNDIDSIFAFLKQMQERLELQKLDQLIIIVEYTGIYVQHLVSCCLNKGIRLSLVAATKVSDQLGGKRGWDDKTDPIDARRLAEYGIRFSDKLKMCKTQDHTFDLLQRLHAQRRRITDVINMLEVPVKESEQFDSVEINNQLKDNQKASIKALKSDLKQIEKQMSSVIKNDEKLDQLFKLITSVCGVGPVTAREVILSTKGFVKFKPNEAKSFARYAGVIPMKWQSGKIKKRDRTSKRSNKKIRKLLTMAATSLIGTKDELAQYYERKISEGKPHFLVINAMRNKLILRIFAVVRNQLMYQKNLNICQS